MINYFAPPEVWGRLSDKSIKKNGCGSGWSAILIPDKWLGLDFTIPCAIHDEMYYLGKTIEDKEEGDRIFLNNMLRVVETRPFVLRPIGKFLAYQYYDKVKRYGGPAYWSGKNKKSYLTKAKIENISKLTQKVVTYL